MKKAYFAGLTFFIVWMTCASLSAIVGEIYGLIMAILVVGWLIIFTKNTQELSSKEEQKQKEVKS